ncbi:MAG TPA: hypothetical protein VLT92_11035 [Burkholderiales bacterium]|nr:hypothetical protein [Burkholderiales bacterium]
MVTIGPRVAVRMGCAMENLMIVPEIIRFLQRYARKDASMP